MQRSQPAPAVGAPGSADLRGLASLVLLALIWGGSIPATKLGLIDLPPLTLTFLRYLAAAPFFLWTLRGRWGEVRREALPLALLALVNAVFGQVFQTVGVRYTSATAAALLNATVPLWFVVLGSIRLGQRIWPRQWVGLAIALSGIALLVVGDLQSLSGLWTGGGLVGNLLMLASAVSVALYYAFSADLSRRLSPLVVAGGTSMIGALILAPLSLWELSGQALRPTPQAFGVVLYLGALVTFAGLQIWLNALKRVPATIAGALQYLQPVVGVGLSTLLLGETLTGRFIAGAGLVMLGISVVSSRPTKGET